MASSPLSGVELEVRGSVALLRLTRPPVNALDGEALEALASLVERVGGDPALRALVIASGLPGIFCAGGDLRYWPRFCGGRAREVSRAGRRVFGALETLETPTVAAIDGHVIGDGASLALSADLRVASPGSRFRLPETAYGFIPGWGTVRRLVEAVGRGVASELLLTGNDLDAHRAYQLGMVNWVVAWDQVLARAVEVAQDLAARSPSALGQVKAAVRGPPARIARMEAWEEEHFAAVWGSPEWRRRVDPSFGRQ